MKNLLSYSLALSLILLSPVRGAESSKKSAADMATTPTEDSKQLASKQLDKSITELKEAIEGVRLSIAKGDHASFKLYRSQARTALMEIDKMGSIEVSAETKTEQKTEKEGKGQT